jgi:hypothetical protein
MKDMALTIFGWLLTAAVIVGCTAIICHAWVRVHQIPYEDSTPPPPPPDDEHGPRLRLRIEQVPRAVPAAFCPI